MTERKPIKRSEELAPLSREHHDSLLFIWKLKEGLKQKISVDRLQRFTIWYWHQHIKPHFFQEEKILLPYLPAGHLLSIRLKKEHDDIREIILRIDQEPEPGAFSQLANLAEKHIRFEEREFFPLLEQSIPAQALQTIHQQLEQHPVCTDKWEDEFWVKK